MVMLNSAPGHKGMIHTFKPNVKYLALNAGDDGGLIIVYNKTGEDGGLINADEYGNGVVGAYIRNGKGRTLQPGS